MVVLHKLNGEEFILNIDQIEKVESKPDTTITLMNNKVYVIRESIKEFLDIVTEYKRNIHSGEMVY